MYLYMYVYLVYQVRQRIRKFPFVFKNGGEASYIDMKTGIVEKLGYIEDLGAMNSAKMVKR